MKTPTSHLLRVNGVQNFKHNFDLAPSIFTFVALTLALVTFTYDLDFDL